MQGNDYARLAYLVLLGLVIGGWFLAENRGNLGKSARQALIWGLIFIGFVAAFGLWSDIRDDVLPRQSTVGVGVIEVPRHFDGHYYLVLHLNGVAVEFIVDTGATDVVLTLQDAGRIGVDLKKLAFNGQANTANGIVKTAFTRVNEVRLGEITDHNLRVSVNGGEMDGSLLGMSYLRRFESIEIKGDRLILKR